MTNSENHLTTANKRQNMKYQNIISRINIIQTLYSNLSTKRIIDKYEGGLSA